MAYDYIYGIYKNSLKSVFKLRRLFIATIHEQIPTNKSRTNFAVLLHEQINRQLSCY